MAGARMMVKGKVRTKQNMQHPAFPRGPPPQYYLGLTLLNFGVRMGSGALGVVWSTTNVFTPMSHMNSCDPRAKAYW